MRAHVYGSWVSATCGMAGIEAGTAFSGYYYGLEEAAKSRYREKLSLLGEFKDPYQAIDLDRETENIYWQNWPAVEYPDIFNYLIATPSPYKLISLEGYRQFIDGWVCNVQVSACNYKFLVTAKVKHSQRLSVPPAKAWIGVENSGTIICGHCDCMAGMGEACSHIAAILFTLEAGNFVMHINVMLLVTSHLQECPIRCYIRYRFFGSRAENEGKL